MQAAATPLGRHPLEVRLDVRPVSAIWPCEKAHLFQEVSRGLDSLLIRIVQLFDIQTSQVTEHAMHPVALFELLFHWKRLTACRRR